MFPLAQINFSETPALTGYPSAGYLQFFITAYSDVYGLDFDDPQRQDNFRVVYFAPEEVSDPVTDFDFLAETMKSGSVPLTGACGLGFALRTEYIGLSDARYNRHMPVDIMKLVAEHPAHEHALETQLYDCFSSSGHKIGGFADFTQDDPRYNAKDWENYILLFQMDSEGEICWGDMGVANFFIHPDDLAKKDFSRVAYNWDCT
jgi:uncharacterized protein YwqG